MKLTEVEGANQADLKSFFRDNLKYNKEADAPSWHEYFIKIAEQVSLRSKDGQTKVGAVLVDRNNHIISTGYNSFPRGLPDKGLPNLRPGKYKWMKHAEKNCILNCQRRPKAGAILYLTGFPCWDCLTDLWSFNVTKIIYNDYSELNGLDRDGSMLKKTTIDPNSLLFIRMTGMKVFKIE